MCSIAWVSSGVTLPELGWMDEWTSRKRQETGQEGCGQMAS
jgi:hypothetical protein